MMVVMDDLCSVLKVREVVNFLPRIPWQKGLRCNQNHGEREKWDQQKGRMPQSCPLKCVEGIPLDRPSLCGTQHAVSQTIFLSKQSSWLASLFQIYSCSILSTIPSHLLQLSLPHTHIQSAIKSCCFCLQNNPHSALFQLPWLPSNLPVCFMPGQCGTFLSLLAHSSLHIAAAGVISFVMSPPAQEPSLGPAVLFWSRIL
jgi:hypothetical protein